MKKKSIVLLLALCMVVSLLPVAGHATREQRYKQPTFVMEYEGGDELVAYTSTSYTADGQPLEEQRMELGEDNGFAEVYYSLYTYDEEGGLLKGEFRENGESWTETYTYEWPTDHSSRITTVRTPGNETTVVETTLNQWWEPEKVTTTVNGRLVAEESWVFDNGSGLNYDVTKHFNEDGSTKLEVSAYDAYTGDYLEQYKCDDLNDISYRRYFDDQENLVMEISCGGEQTRHFYADDVRIKSETREGSFLTVTTYDSNGNVSEVEHFLGDRLLGKASYDYDELGCVTKQTNTDSRGDVTWIIGYEYQEFVIPAEPTFDDVPVDAFYFDPVEWAVENGITVGTGNGCFDPNGTCTRSQVVTFLWRAMGWPEIENWDNPFTDVPDDAWFFAPVLWAAENGITSGVGGGRFDPDGTCTRSQIVTFLWRANGCPEPENADNPFSDVSESDWYYKAVLWAVENGITLGVGGGRFDPNGTCTRGQVVTFLFRNMGE